MTRLTPHLWLSCWDGGLRVMESTECGRVFLAHEDATQFRKVLGLHEVIETDALCHEVLCYPFCVVGFCLSEIAYHVRSILATGSTAFADRLRYFRAMGASGSKCVAIVMGGERKSVHYLMFKWVSSVSGNVKNALPLGIFHNNRDQHAPRYLVNFECLFNRRFDFLSIIGRLLFIFLRILPMSCHFLRQAEVYE